MNNPKKRNLIIALIMILTVILLIITDSIITNIRNNGTNENVSINSEADIIIDEFAKENGLQAEDYPEKMRELLNKNPETEEFVLNYPLKKDSDEDYSMDEYKNCKTVPHFLQWDMRWGYKEYAGELMALSGCGPVCLSMVAVYLTGDIKYNPEYIACFAEKEGYASQNNGTSWSLMSEGAQKLGLESKELPLHKNSMINALNDGNPIILIMKPGDFTTEGHFIVLTDYSEEGFSVLDPNSKVRSAQKWTYERIENQINNIWAFSLPD